MPSRPTAKSDRDRLIERHIQLPAIIANKIIPRSNAFDDIEADGFSGLVQAADNFQPGRGADFQTFAWYRIRGAILDGARRNRRTMATADTAPLSAAKNVTDRASPDIEDLIDRRRTLAKLRDHVSRLPEREQQVARSHYFSGKTIQETAAEIGHSEFTTSRIHTRMLRQLREALSATESP